MRHVIATCAVALTCAAGPATAADFNPYVLRAVEQLSAGYRGGGYDLSSAFTHDLPYGQGVVKKTSAKASVAPSMCVAGVAEIILTAIKIYADEQGFRDASSVRSPFTKAPLNLWTKGNVSSLRANIFMFAGTGSRGTAHALARFGMGRELPFSQLVPGDFINLNRAGGSGHAVVFLGYLDGNGGAVSTYGPSVKGFKYFSVQGKGRADAGFAYRYAYFNGTCVPSTATKIHDCKVIRSANPALLNTGRMHMPDNWTVAASLAELRNNIGRSIELTNPGVTRAFIDAELDQELPPAIDSRLDGVEGE